MGEARVNYDEFSMFGDNAEEYGIPYAGPPVVRRESVELPDGRRLSALVWGTAAPELVFLHGGAQNAHTWDTVALALGRPLVCIDLPGHGHSDGGRHGSLSLPDNADDVAVAIGALAPTAAAVIGMSLGGLTTLTLLQRRPELVRKAVLVDVTPGVNEEKSKQISDFIRGPESFPSFAELLARTIEYNPTRTESSLRRGILHNALQHDDGSWVWRYRRFAEAEGGNDAFRDFDALWATIRSATCPMLLVRGMRSQSVVSDEDEERWLAANPRCSVARVQEAGHSVQGDTPVELAALIADFVR